MKRLWFIIALCTFVGTVFLGSDALAQVSAQDGGVLFQGIANRCYTNGNCQIKDIIIVFANAGNFTLKIAGALVFFFYVFGGLCLLASGINSGWVQTGKTAIKTSSIGLIIVFVAYIGVFTLQKVITTGDIYFDGSYLICDGSNDGDLCGENSRCQDGVCQTQCAIDHGQTEDGGKRVIFSCVPSDSCEGENKGTNLCPSGNTCCGSTN